MSRRRKRQCFPIFEAGSSPTRASLYTVDFGTRRNRATSITVKISLSVELRPSDWSAVAVDPELFMTKNVSAWPQENLSRCPPGTQFCRVVLQVNAGPAHPRLMFCPRLTEEDGAIRSEPIGTECNGPYRFNCLR